MERSTAEHMYPAGSKVVTRCGTDGVVVDHTDNGYVRIRRPDNRIVSARGEHVRSVSAAWLYL